MDKEMGLALATKQLDYILTAIETDQFEWARQLFGEFQDREALASLLRPLDLPARMRDYLLGETDSVTIDDKAAAKLAASKTRLKEDPSDIVQIRNAIRMALRNESE